MPELSPHEIVTTALFLSMLLLLAIASILNGGNARRCIAVLALATGAAASIGIVTRPPGASTWYNGGSGATFGRKADDSDAGGGAGSAGAGGGGFALTAFGRTAGNTDTDAFRDCPHCPEMVPLKSSYAQLGASEPDPRAEASELLQRIVRLAKQFAIGRTEITVAQYSAFTVATGRAVPACAESAATPGDKPAECVSFADTRAYVAWLSGTTGRTYRLPSASEWENAARAGSAVAYPARDNLQPHAANIGPSAVALKPAGAFPANGFGLRDMVGSLAKSFPIAGSRI